MQSQEGINVQGALQLHSGGNLGIHTNLNNDGFITAEDQTLIGLYGINALIYTGDEPLSAYDLELLNNEGLFVNEDIEIRNNLNLVEGIIVTNNNVLFPKITLINDAFYAGEGNTTHVVGFVGMQGKSDFTFPVGNGVSLRSLTYEANSKVTASNCAYFSENPSSPASYNANFNTETLSRGIGQVTSYEFWVLTGNQNGQVTLSWDTNSRLDEIANIPEDLIVVGWNISSNQWTSLGRTAVGGDLDEGFIVSETFMPNDYAAITFGINPLPTDTFAVNVPTLGDYFISPNNDGINEFLVFDFIEGIETNQTFIFNKFGQKVFEQENYTNQFNGTANTGSLYFRKQLGLPEGVYYYMVKLPTENLEYFGIIYLDR